MWRRVSSEPEIELPARDARILEKYHRRVDKFSRVFKLCCCWIGYDLLLEFIPIVGKVISLCFSLSLYWLACKVVLPRTIQRRMLRHIAIDFLLGLPPIIGILFTALYQAQSKNERILEKFLYSRARQNQ